MYDSMLRATCNILQFNRTSVENRAREGSNDFSVFTLVMQDSRLKHDFMLRGRYLPVRCYEILPHSLSLLGIGTDVRRLHLRL